MDVFRGACVSVKLSNRDVAASERRVSPTVVDPIDRSSQGDPTSRQALERPSTQPAPPAKFAAVRPRGSDGRDYGGGFAGGDIFLGAAGADPTVSLGSNSQEQRSQWPAETFARSADLVELMMLPIAIGPSRVHL